MGKGPYRRAIVIVLTMVFGAMRNATVSPGPNKLPMTDRVCMCHGEPKLAALATKTGSGIGDEWPDSIFVQLQSGRREPTSRQINRAVYKWESAMWYSLATGNVSGQKCEDIANFQVRQRAIDVSHKGKSSEKWSLMVIGCTFRRLGILRGNPRCYNGSAARTCQKPWPHTLRASPTCFCASWASSMHPPRQPAMTQTVMMPHGICVELSWRSKALQQTGSIQSGRYKRDEACLPNGRPGHNGTTSALYGLLRTILWSHTSEPEDSSLMYLRRGRFSVEYHRLYA
ncbi:hypothetical protein QBC37DRAFT_400450 [Rhypophila decipiens]|uniref:Uncharacterized protein n=1 Tax=Rhypophila decipiens TaxID=261697 RepID=A0AAN7B5H3_9PEZI|nr:hypothetical protein QBC37DRAFT_400450 [Rhypophila decipiens]